ncbi:hypothetical protein KPY62_01655 [Psychrobacter sp. TAE2020]|uniref:DUF6334 family protein n=1 Tax=Psychrobacter sp. TAE2020 TaxID=2846762 RepID=UPI001C118238|nr:DUF6334 family protein [Psychrobacter sp. TAE2020]MBU5615826.1 hypothetical protein [Psychrobacter sp. TAE2020]
MNNSDMFEDKINVDGIVNILSMRFYIDEDMPDQIKGAPDQIECIQFETDVLGTIYLNVNNDTDELYWSIENLMLTSSYKYMETKNPFSANSFTVFYYWHMINNTGSHDAIQFHVRVENKDKSQLSYLQFMGAASTIWCHEFGKSTNYIHSEF